MDQIVQVSGYDQKIQFPLGMFEETPGLCIGNYVQVDLSDDVQVLGRCFLINPSIANYSKVSNFVLNNIKQFNKSDLNKGSKIKKVVKIEPKDASEIDVELICDTVKTTLMFKNDVLKAASVIKLLKGLLVKTGSVVNFQLHPLANEFGIRYIIINCHQDDDVQVLTDKTKIKSLKVETLHRRLKSSKSIPLGGLSKQEIKLKDILKVHRSRPDSSNINLSGFLISGPSGSGKSRLIKKIAQADDYLILTIQCSELMRPHPGETEKVLKDVFAKANLHVQEGPTLLILEDIDLIGSQNGDDSRSSANLRAVSQLRSLLDNVGPSSLIIGATTSTPTDVHESLRRPGRLTHEIFIQVPNLQERQEIVHALSSDTDHDQCLEIAQATQGYLGTDLASLLSSMALSVDESLDFKMKLKEGLKSTAPSGFKSGIGSVQLCPISWSQIGGLQDVKKQLQTAVNIFIRGCPFIEFIFFKAF
jgi:hypothetical protein